MVRIHALLDEGLVVPRLAARDRAGVLREMSDRLEARHAPGLDGTLLDKLLKREEMGTTAIGKGVAVPHCRAKGLKSLEQEKRPPRHIATAAARGLGTADLEKIERIEV